MINLFKICLIVLIPLQFLFGGDRSQEEISVVLEKLSASTHKLESYKSKLFYTFSQPVFETKTVREGELFYKKYDSKSKLRINFESIKQDNEKAEKQLQEYIFDGVWLTVIDHPLRDVKRFQQAEVNEPVDAFELAAANFPMIGFGRERNLDENFEVIGMEKKGGKIKLILQTRDNCEYSDDYEKIELWLDSKAYLPVRIEAYTPEEDIYIFEMKKEKINGKIRDKVFDYTIPAGFVESKVVPMEKKGEKQDG